MEEALSQSWCSEFKEHQSEVIHHPGILQVDIGAPSLTLATRQMFSDIL